MADDAEVAQGGMTPVKALVTLALSMLFVVFYSTLATKIGIRSLFGGFVFLTVFGTIDRVDPRRMPATLAGCLAGVALGWGFSHLPLLYGTAGTVVVGVLLLASIFCVIMGLFPFVLNIGFLLMLTVGTIPPVAAEDRFFSMAASVLLMAGLIALIFTIAGLVARARAPR